MVLKAKKTRGESWQDAIFFAYLQIMATLRPNVNFGFWNSWNRLSGSARTTIQGILYVHFCRL